MVITIPFVLLICALVCFLLAAFGYPKAPAYPVNLTAFGLALYVLSLLIR